MSPRVASNHAEVAVLGCPRPSWVARYRSYCRRLLAALDREGTEVSVLLTSDTRLRARTRGYRGRDRATDGLSFEQPASTLPGGQPGAPEPRAGTGRDRFL